jgi:hypothetical protein
MAITCSAAARTAAGAPSIKPEGDELGATPGLDGREPSTWIFTEGSLGNGAGARRIGEVCVWVIID